MNAASPDTRSYASAECASRVQCVEAHGIVGSPVSGGSLGEASRRRSTSCTSLLHECTSESTAAEEGGGLWLVLLQQSGSRLRNVKGVKISSRLRWAGASCLWQQPRRAWSFLVASSRCGNPSPHRPFFVSGARGR